MRFPLLDPLRGLAAACVFLHHLSHTPAGPASPLFRLGYFCVPLLFVISGYCMAAAGRRAVRDGESAGRFLFRRAVRVFPPFWAAVAVAVGVYALLPLAGPPLGPQEEYVRAGWKSLDAAGWASQLTLTAVFAPDGRLLWDKTAVLNVVYWTLAIEVQFYLVVGLAVRAGRNFYRVLLFVTLVSLPFLPTATAFRVGWFLPFWPFFALGVGLYAAAERERAAGMARGGRWTWAVVGAAVCAHGLAATALVPNGSAGMIRAEFIFAVGFAAVLWAVRPGERPAPVGGLLGYLGRSSYSLYLLHIPLMLAAAHAVGKWVPPGSAGHTAAVVAVVCGLVYPFYRWVERPCMCGRPRRPAA